MRTLIKRGSEDTISEGDCIDPRGLGTQLFSAASPNQVIKFNAYSKGVAFGRASTLKKHIDVVHLKIKRSRGAK